jgi:hypothetical protein
MYFGHNLHLRYAPSYKCYEHRWTALNLQLPKLTETYQPGLNPPRSKTQHNNVTETLAKAESFIYVHKRNPSDSF